MRRRTFHHTLAAIPVCVALGATAQSRPLRVAWVSTERKERPSQNYRGLSRGMRELGYTEGRDLLIDAWWGEGSRDRVRKDGARHAECAARMCCSPPVAWRWAR